MGTNLKGMQRAQLAKAIKVEPYKALTVEASKYFYDLAECRASYDWSKADLIMLTRLSDWLDQADKANEELQIEGFICTSAKGGTYPNPLVSVCDTFERRIAGIMVKLAIFQISAKSNLASNGKKQALAKDAASTPDDDLLG